MKRLLTILMLLTASLPLWAYEFEHKGFNYQTTSDTEVELVQGETDAYYHCEITIPATVDHEGVTYTVTAIGNYAFTCRDNLRSVTIPEGVTHIGEKAFDGCWELRNIAVWAKTPPTIHDNTFSNWEALLSFPEGCEEAYRNAEYWSWFANYEELSPGAGICFEHEGFNYQTLSYTKVKLVQGDTEAYNQSIITIPATVEHEGVTYTVTTIGENAFYGCEPMGLIIPEVVTRIGANAFGMCTTLYNIIIKAKTPPSIGSNEGYFRPAVYVPEGCEEAYRTAEYWSDFTIRTCPIEYNNLFYNKISDTEVEVTEHPLSSMMRSAYSGDIVIPDNIVYNGTTYDVTAVGNNAFSYSGIGSLIVGNNVRDIKEGAISYMASLKYLTIPESVTNIERGFLDYGHSVKSIIVKATTPPNVVGIFGEVSWSDPNEYPTLYVPAESVEAYKAHAVWGTCPSIKVLPEKGNEFTIDGINYLVTEGFDVEVIGTTQQSSIEQLYIVEEVTYNDVTYTVRSITAQAFYNCDALTTISLHKNLATIGEEAFANCDNLETVISFATTPPAIAANTFDNNAIALFVKADCVAAYQAAEHWSNFGNINVLPEVGGLYTIDMLTYKILSDEEVSLVSCNTEATDLVEIPQSIEISGVNYKVVAIENNAFKDCVSMTKVIISENIRKIGHLIFINCPSLTAIDWRAINCPLEGSPYGDWMVCSQSAYCPDYDSDHTNAFIYNITEFTFGDKVEHLPNYLCAHIRWDLVNHLPASLKSMDVRPLPIGNAGDTLYCNAPEPPAIDYYTFIDDEMSPAQYTTCDNVVLVVPEGCVNKYRNAEYWKMFKTITCPGAGVRFEDNGIAYESIATDRVVVVAKENGPYSGDIVIPSTVSYNNVTYNVTEIAARAFAGCYELGHVHIEDGVEKIDSEAFWNCQNMYNINLPLTLKEIGNNAFEYCSGLTNVIIPEGVTAIASKAFNYCTSINTLVLPSTLLSIGEGAFSDNWALIQIECDATTPPQLASDMFYGHVVLYVPEGCVDAYRNAEYWSNITNIREFPFEVDGLYYEVISDNTVAVMPNRKERYSGEINIPTTIEHKGATYQVTTIGKRAFAHSYDITEFVIPPHITTIEESAFEWCSSLTSMTIPATVMSIGNNAFNKCILMTSVVIEDSDEALALGDLCDGSSLYELYLGRNLIYDAYSISSPFPVTLTTVTIGDKVTSLSVGLFCDCWLQTIKLGKNVTEIADNAFQTCRYLQTIEWNDKVNYIGNYAFYQCDKLERIELPAGIQAINYATFGECYKLKSVVIPAGVNYIAEYAFYQCKNLSSIEVNAATPPTLAAKHVFEDAAYNSCQLIVEYGCLEAYNNALYWNEFRHISERSSDNYFAIRNVSAGRGSCVTIPVELVNKNVISSFQADLYLPAGIELMKKDGEYQLELSNRATSSHIITAAEQSDGAMRILCYSSQVEPLTGNDGDLFSMAIEVASNFNGESNIQMKNIKLITPDNIELSASELNIELQLTAGDKGDANSDGQVDIADINTVAGYIVSPAGYQINLTQADVSEDSSVNVIDIVGITNIILGNMPHTNAPKRVAAQDEDGSNRFYIEDFNIKAGEECEIAIVLDNNVPFTAFQTDIYLPAGLSIKQDGNTYDIALTHRKNGHVISAAKQVDGAVRILAYSATSKEFSGNNGELVTFTIVADETFENGMINIKNIIFSQKDMTGHDFDDCSVEVNGKNSAQLIDDSNVTIVVVDGYIHIDGVDENTMIDIYITSGMLVKRTTADLLSTMVMPHGVYIVKVNNCVEKVIL